MKWVNHRIVGFSLPFAVTGSLLFSLSVAAFSAVPDSIEGRRLILKHRGISHNMFFWFGVYAATGISFIFIKTLLPQCNPAITILLANAGLSFFAGVLLHLLADSLTMTGIPLNPIKKRFAFKLFRTGQPVEYVISSVTLVTACLINYRLFRNSFLYLNNSVFHLKDLLVLSQQTFAGLLAH